MGQPVPRASCACTLGTIGGLALWVGAEPDKIGSVPGKAIGGPDKPEYQGWIPSRQPRRRERIANHACSCAPTNPIRPAASPLAASSGDLPTGNAAALLSAGLCRGYNTGKRSGAVTHGRRDLSEPDAGAMLTPVEFASGRVVTFSGTPPRDQASTPKAKRASTRLRVCQASSSSPLPLVSPCRL